MKSCKPQRGWSIVNHFRRVYNFFDVAFRKIFSSFEFKILVVK